MTAVPGGNANAGTEVLPSGNKTIMHRGIDISAVPVAERDLVHSMLDGGAEAVKYIFDHLSLEDFQHPTAREVASTILHAIEEGKFVNAQNIVDEFPHDAEKHFVSTLTLSRYSLSRKWAEHGGEVTTGQALDIARDAVRAMKREMIQQRKRENKRAMEEAIKRGEDWTPYLERDRQLDQLKKDLNLT